MGSVARETRPSFRPMGTDDLAAVMAIEPRAYDFHWPESIFRECMRVGYSCWIMEVDGQVEGYAVMSITVGEAHMMNLCVRPESQGRGLGGELLETMLNIARQEGAETAYLEVRPSNIAALRLYRRHGFERVGQRRGYYPAEEGREDAVIMSRALTEEPATHEASARHAEKRGT